MQGRAGQGRAGQGRAGQGRAGPCRAGLDHAGQGIKSRLLSCTGNHIAVAHVVAKPSASQGSIAI